MRFHVFASEPNYYRHVDAVWKHLPEHLRGRVKLAGSSFHPFPEADRDDIVVLGGAIDIDRIPSNRIILVEHGAGQRYEGIAERHHRFYGGADLQPERVVGFVVPRQEIADAIERPAFAAGCPAVDEIKPSPGEYVACTFHFDAYFVCPEARSARDHYLPFLPAMALWAKSQGYNLIGHGHPRDRRARETWESIGIPFVPNVDTVLETADFLIADNTSVLYEAALIGLPTIALNAPWYRRHVNHGLRFWDAIPGRAVNCAGELFEIDLDMYLGSREWIIKSEHAALAAYGTLERGSAGRRAADWLVSTFAEG